MSKVGSYSPSGGGGTITMVNGGTNITVNTVGTVATVNLNDDVILAGYISSIESRINSTGVGIDATYFTNQAYVQTNDATQTELEAFAVAEEQMITIKAMINGFRDSFDDSTGAEVLITAYRPTGGDVTLVGAPVINSNTTSLTSIDADVDIGTQTVRLLVTGVAAQTWNWVSTQQYMYLVDGV